MPGTVAGMSDQNQNPETSQPVSFKDRVLGMRAVIAVALASVILGGVGGAALGAISSGSDDGGGGGFGPPGMGGGNRGGNFAPQQRGGPTGF